MNHKLLSKRIEFAATSDPGMFTHTHIQVTRVNLVSGRINVPYHNTAIRPEKGASALRKTGSRVEKTDTRIGNVHLTLPDSETSFV